MKQRRYLVSSILPIAFVCSMACQSVYADDNHRSVPFPLGKLINQQSVTCPSGAAPGAVCTHAVVTGCKDANGNALPDEGVTIAVTQPQLGPDQRPKGTIVLHSGGAGSSFYNGAGGSIVNFASYFASQGYTTVDLAWDLGPTKQGWNVDSAGVIHNACRPATVFDAIYKDPQAHVKGTAYCGMGSSGGSAALGFALAYYGTTVPGHEHDTQSFLFNFVNLTNGPATARLDVACAPAQAYNNAPITNCGITSYPSKSAIPPNTTAPVYSFPAGGNPVNAWEGTTTCGTANPPQADIDKWARDGNVSSGPLAYQAVYNYPHTNVSFYFCGAAINNQSLAMGWFLTQKIQPRNGTNGGLAPVNCFTQCTNEKIYQDPNAVAQTESDMLKYCVINNRGDNGDEGEENGNS